MDQIRLLSSQLAFSHFPSYPQANWALVVLIPGWVGLCTFQDPVGLSNKLSCEAESFSHCRLNPQTFFSHRCQGYISLHWNPGLHSLSQSGLSTPKCGTTWSSSHCLAGCPLHPSCPSPPLLPVWMNVSSLTPWLSDFHTVQFSGSSDCFFILKCVVVLPLVVQGSKVYLAMPPSWPEVHYTIVYNRK